MVNSVVRLDKVKSVYGGHIFSVEAPVALQNGFVAAIKGLKDGEREVNEIEIAGADKSIVLIANPAVIYDNARMGANNEQNYAIAEGEIVRAYEITKGDIFSVTKEGLEGEPLKGKFVVADDASYKLKVVDALVGTEVFAAKIARIDTVGLQIGLGGTASPLEYAVLEVLAN